MLRSLRSVSSLLIILALTLTTILCLGYPLAAAGNYQPPQSGDIGFGFDDLANGADIITTGTIIENTSYWNEEHTNIYTTAILSVEETLKGTESNSTIAITYPGGQVEEIGEWISDGPILNQGEQVLVFLKEILETEINPIHDVKKSHGERYEIYGGFFGKYEIRDKKVGSIPLSEFKQRVKNVIEGQQLSIAAQEIPAEEVTFPWEYAGFCWPHPPNPNVSFYINENSPDCSNEASSVAAASLTWNATEAKFSFNYAGPTTALTVGRNGVNEIIWVNLGNTPTLAQTTIWHIGSSIIECDMEFNDYYTWSTAVTPLANQYDVESTALHEFGHYLMLEDLYSPTDSAKVMYGYGSPGTTKRVLHSDDKAGIRAIYGYQGLTVINTGASNITGTSADLHGEVLVSILGEIPEIYLYWGTTDGGTATGSWQHSQDIGPRVVGTFGYILEGLSPDTTYYYRYYSTATWGDSWAPDTTSFTTLDTPVITNSDGASDVTSNSARLNGEVLSAGTDNPEVHVYWGDNDGEMLSGNWDHDINLGLKSAGDFSANVSELAHGKPYYYRCYAVNTAGGGWAPSTSSFTTLRTLSIDSIGNGTTDPTTGTYDYVTGAVVNILAVPGTEAHFIEWTGDIDTVSDPHSASTNITINGDYTITANFGFRLDIGVSGNGTTDPTVGSHTYPEGATVNISAIPATHWAFSSWTGNVTDNISANTTITMDTDKAVTANFIRTQGTLTLAVNGNGTTNPTAGTTYAYPAGALENLVATPAPGWRFHNWTGDVDTVADVNSANTTIIINGDYSVTANFDRPILTVSVNGNGTTSPEVGTHSYDWGSTVNITATASANWAFSSWSGDVADNMSANTTVTIDNDKTVTANFVRTHGDVTIAVLGNGNVTPEVGIHNYTVGENVTLVAIPASGWRFVNWTGDVSMVADVNSANTTLTINGDYVITANFAIIDTGVSPGGGGGGGGSAVAGKSTTIFGEMIDDQGLVVEEVQAVSFDNMAILDVLAGTLARDKGGNPLRAIKIVDLTDPHEPQAGGVLIGKVHEFSPSGATFDPPITLIMSYNDSDLPAGMNEETLCIAFWNEDTGSYIPIDGVLDTDANSITTQISHFSQYTILSLPRPAKFTLSGLVITPTSVNPGDNVDISVTITNTGDLSGEYDCNVMGDNVSLQSKRVILEGGAQTTLHFTITAKSEGVHYVSIGSFIGSYTVRLTPASFKVSSLVVSPDEVDIGHNVEISVIVKNTGQSTGSCELKLNINGSIIETKNVALGGGEEQKVSFTFSGDEAGKKLVDVNGLTGQFIIRGEVTPPEQMPLPSEQPTPSQVEGITPEPGTVAVANPSSGVNWPLISGISGGGLVLVACVVYLIWWRRRTKS